MSKRFVLRSFLLFICSYVLAPAANSQPSYLHPRIKPSGLYQVSMGGKKSGRSRVGFINKTGKIVIGFDRLPERTVYVGEFEEGRALISVRKEKLDNSKSYKNFPWGYIDETGAVVIAPRFYSARGFSEGLAYVATESFHGFIDRNGKVSITLGSNSSAKDFHEGLAAASRNKDWGYINRTGKWVIKPQYSFADDFSEGLAGVAMERKYGFIDQKGEMVIRPHFLLLADDELERKHYAGRFSEGLALVAVDMFDEFKRNGYRTLFGYINRSGDFVIPPKFTYAQEFSDGLAWVTSGDNSQSGWIDKSGQWVVTGVDGEKLIGIVVEDWRYSEGLVPFTVLSEGKYRRGYMDQKGKAVIRLGDENEFGTLYPFIGGLAKVDLPRANTIEDYGYINRTGQFIWRTP